MITVHAYVWARPEHADTYDGTAGLTAKNTNLPDKQGQDWTAYYDKLEQAARQAAGK
ncbi:hypothetical protein [Glycomyces dulcitolivorans]|uniref:hypothetical protein n=1 Tax=Glycomyces dulcitolivorans TaxID=2200759 RepID=UPI0013002B11|nr:hypothetical protein [Glycomyces dulcitolivorans]